MTCIITFPGRLIKLFDPPPPFVFMLHKSGSFVSQSVLLYKTWQDRGSCQTGENIGTSSEPRAMQRAFEAGTVTQLMAAIHDQTVGKSLDLSTWRLFT